jgi:hypothetical protein
MKRLRNDPATVQELYDQVEQLKSVYEMLLESAADTSEITEAQRANALDTAIANAERTLARARGDVPGTPTYRVHLHSETYEPRGYLN